VQARCQKQLSLQRWLPPAPQPRSSPGAQAPSSLQRDQSDQRPVSPSQLRPCSPQLPQLRTASPRQTCPVQVALQWQLESQLCVPPEPQPRVSSGSHSPSPLQLDQSDQRPLSLSQIRV